MAPTPAKKAPAKKVAATPAKAAGKTAAAKAGATRAGTAKSPAKKAPAKATKAPAKSAKSTAAKSTKSTAAKGRVAKAPATKPAKSAKPTATKAASAKSTTKSTTAKSAAAKSAAPPARSRKDGAVKSSGHFDAPFLASQRELLLEERANLVGQAQRLEDEAAELMEDLDPGDVQFDDESGEGDTLVVERERDLALSAQARQTVIDIDAALGRIKDGSYGFSVVSGRPIPKERLKAIPWATELVEEKVGGLGSRR
jgi:RNA polymerase-binding transcription factor DksA